MTAPGPVYDAIVIGAGASGSLAAHELTRAGLQVLLLDAGPEIERQHRLVPPRRPGDLLDRARLALRGQHIQARCFACTPATSSLYVNDRENPYSTAPGAPFTWFRGRQVGGRLHTWGRVVPRFSNWEFRPGAHGRHGLDWPIAYEDLAPYYSRVERLLGVHGEPAGPPQMPDGAFLPARPLTDLETHIRDAVAQRWPTRGFRAAPVVGHDPLPRPLPLRAALETGSLTLRANAVVARIVLDRAGEQATGIEFVDRVTKAPGEARGRRIVLCASAIESVRILFNSACERHPEGLGNSSGLLGRFLMDHCMVAVAGEAPEPVIPQFRVRPAVEERDPGDLASMYLYMPGFRNITEPPRTSYTGSFSILGAAGRHGREFILLGFGEMLPSGENRIRIDASRRDAWGIPVAHLECRHSANERALIGDMRETMLEMVDAAGLRVRTGPDERGTVVRRMVYGMLWRHVLTEHHAFHPGGAIHEVGGARMGDDPRSSVVNRYNQCWDVPNVLVTDGACFVTSGHQSHTLTLMALTARACDFITNGDRAGVT